MDGANTPPLEELLGHERWLQNLARSLVHDEATADDLVQETWHRALKARVRVDEPRSWLGKVLRNVWRERGRSERARKGREERFSVPERDPQRSPDETLERIELQQRLTSLVTRLEDTYRDVVLFHYYEGLSAAEIARRTGEPADRVRWRLMRARQLLRERLEREEGNTWSLRLALLLPLAERPTETALAAGSAASATTIGVSWMSGKFLLGLTAGLLATITLTRLGGESRPGELDMEGPVSDAEVASTAGPELTSPSEATPRSPLLPDAAVRALGTPALEGEAAPALGGIQGLVVDARDGTPLDQVEVVLVDDPRNEALDERTTGSAGTFSFAELEPSTYQLAFLSERHVPLREEEVVVTVGDTVRFTTALRAGFAVEAFVFERGSEHPIEGAEVQLIAGEYDKAKWIPRQARRYHSVVATTADGGRTEVHGCERGLYQYFVRAPGYATAIGETLIGPADSRPTLRVALDPGNVVTGRVHARDGSPATGARVFLNSIYYRKHFNGERLPQNGVAVDDEGVYRFEGIPTGAYYMAVLHADGSGTFHFARDAAGQVSGLEPILVQPGEQARVDIELPLPGRIEGRVVDDQDRPIPGARVSVSWGDFKPPKAGFFDISRVGLKDPIHHACVTDEDGRFTMEAVRASYEPLSLTARPKGYVASTIELDVPPGETTRTTLRVEGLGATIRGRLVDEDGEPVAGLTVGAFATKGEKLGAFFMATSQADGSYELSVPEELREHRVYPILRDDDPYLSDPERREGIPTGAEGIDFRLSPRQELAGVVVDESGTPIRDFQVHAREIDSGELEFVDDANRGEGRFRFYVSDETHDELRFSAPGFDPHPVGLAALSERIVLSRASDLQGRVVDPDGAGVEGVLVALATLDGAIYPRGTEFSPRTTSDSRGRFVLEGVPASTGGTLLVCPRREDMPALVHYPLAEVRATGAELVVPRSTSVELRFEAADGRAMEGVCVMVDAEGWPLDPRTEAHLQPDFADEFGILIDGRVRFQLVAGAHHAVLIDETGVQHPFPLEVGTAAQVERFVVER